MTNSGKTCQPDFVVLFLIRLIEKHPSPSTKPTIHDSILNLSCWLSALITFLLDIFFTMEQLYHSSIRYYSVLHTEFPAYSQIFTRTFATMRIGSDFMNSPSPSATKLDKVIISLQNLRTVHSLFYFKFNDTARVSSALTLYRYKDRTISLYWICRLPIWFNNVLRIVSEDSLRFLSGSFLLIICIE